MPVKAGENRILILGDSLSAAYGIRLERGWVALLEARLADQGYRYRVTNASVSGDTSRGALARLDGLLRTEPPRITIVELGGNDGLRGIPVEEIRDNLDEIVDRLLRAGSRVLLIPMQLPANYGQAYIDKFDEVYRDVAASRGVTLGDFILDDVALRAELMQEDGIHPRARAEPIIMERVWHSLRTMLEPPPPGVSK